MKKILYTLTTSLMVLLLQAQTTSKYIVIDQFGYLPESKKIAVLRDPQKGFDATESFNPGKTYKVINKQSGDIVLSGAPIIFNYGEPDPSSGDKCWWFDFSSLKTPGTYYILDADNDARSFDFDIRNDVYADAMKQAIRSFYYQRCGFEKEAKYAGEGWADKASHLGPLQDKNCRLFSAPENATTERDLSGGWYDAGDYNKYVNFTWGVLIEMLTAYEESPKAFKDDYNIPESGNGIPDMLDEIKWELDWLLKMQQSDGSVLSLVSIAHASPPSAATGQSLYGPVSTSATLTCAGVFALASKVYATLGHAQLKVYADTLKKRAIKAWQWADKNPAVIFYNNRDEAPYFSKGLAAGQQEVDDQGRFERKLTAACFLYAITGNKIYHSFFTTNYKENLLMKLEYITPFKMNEYYSVLYYTKLPLADKKIASEILNRYKKHIETNKDASVINDKDPYMAYIRDYVWGSNMTKGKHGFMLYAMSQYKLDMFKDKYYKELAQGYINYIHGVNPLQIVYLTNMNAYGAENSSNEIYHSWFENGNALWDNVKESKYGPPPGYIVGGANPQYRLDDCCSNGTQCYNSFNYMKCSKNVSPPFGQPTQKSFKDFNDSWPLNSWAVTENAIYYNSAYIKLLSKFIK